mmetsp:Transcript_19644/g.36980  ORF Transcript_19644/g.36980 Transcript_19644/m.36980 type:complete len:85 (-) Transcript_19644:196-450(-)
MHARMDPIQGPAGIRGFVQGETVAAPCRCFWLLGARVWSVCAPHLDPAEISMILHDGTCGVNGARPLHVCRWRRGAVMLIDGHS